eukprot:1158479-Pelagomonas_calceolata.AAC.2
MGCPRPVFGAEGGAPSAGPAAAARRGAGGHYHRGPSALGLRPGRRVCAGEGRGGWKMFPYEGSHVPPHLRL